MEAKNSSGVRVRFAPSPTGYLHIGGARTALFNWLFARRYSGTLILRIEDTDFERSSEEMVTGIVEGLRWLGLDWDEGPFFQSRRRGLYRDAAARLVESRNAYYCFCTKAELEERRETATRESRPPRYDGACRRISAAEAERRKTSGEPCAVRFAVPSEGSTVVEDAVFGRVEFHNHEIEDFVLLRSDGVPTYHLSVVADDSDMGITHILRGADHLSNTPKQIMLYRALGVPLPVFAHVPLILGPDKSRLSKRHGATSVIAYRDEGIVPEAFRNFLALMGWTPANDGGPAREIFQDAELIANFSLEGISRSNAVFDRAKLDWFNTEYIRAYRAEQLLPLIEVEWAKVGLKPRRNDHAWLCSTIDLLKNRARNLRDFAGSFAAFFSDDFVNDPAAYQKYLKDSAVRSLLAELGERYQEASAELDEGTAEKILRDFAAEKEVKAGVLINGARVALTGQAVAPGLFAVMAALGKETTVRRLLAVNQTRSNL